MTRQQLEKVKTSSTPKTTTKPTSKSRKHSITAATRPGKHTPAPVLKPTKPVPTQIQFLSVQMLYRSMILKQKVN